MNQLEDIYLNTPEKSTNQSTMADTDQFSTLTSAISNNPLQPQARFSEASSSSSCSYDQIPVSPTFSLRQSGRFSSANSSLASSPAIRSSLDGFAKMPLTEVKEEKEIPQSNNLELRDPVSTILENKDNIEANEAFPDYEWVDSPPYESSEFDFSHSKRRCADGSSSTGLAARLTTRFPSIAKRIKSKRENRSSSVTASIRDSFVSRSRASSLRSSNVFDKAETPPPPPMPEISHDLDMDSSINLEDEDFQEEEEQVEFARTPLLPPVLAVKMEPEDQIQSPLQSPSVDPTASIPQSPYDSPNPGNYLPSPPLSTRPSVASFHHRSILPSADIPALNLVDIPDEWSNRLGHGNFTIIPEPYQLQAPVTLEDCVRQKADWDLAKKNFEAHLQRTGQAYNESSHTYHLTQVKWAEINLRWKTYHDQALDSIPRISQETLQASLHQDSIVPANTVSIEPAPRSPTAKDTITESKFPSPCASGIIGPMEQIAPLEQIKPRQCRKRSFWKFFQGVWPSTAWGTSQA